MEKENEYINMLLHWHSNCGNPDVVIHKHEHVGDFGTGDDGFGEKLQEPFLRITPQLWENKKVLDLGCGGPSTRNLLRKLYQNVDYTGVDLCKGEGIDIKADATNTIPFMGLRLGKDFDTIACFGFLPQRYLSWPIGNIRHLRKYLKDDGYFVSSFAQALWHQKPEIYTTIADSFRVVEERIYTFTFKRNDSNFAMPINEHCIIAVHKK